MSEPLRVALVGCGAMGSIVVREVYGAGGLGVTLTCIVDAVVERAVALGAELGVPAYGSLEDAVEAREVGAIEVDAVDVRTPHAQHAAVAEAAAARGLHVLVEKPLAADLSGAQQIVAAAESAGVVLAVAENYPHLRTVAAARAALAYGAVGDVVAIRTTRAYRLGGVWLRDGWRTGDSAQAGVLLDQGTHQASLLRLLGGPIASVAAAPSAGSGRDTIALTLHLASGVIAQSLLTWVSPAAGPATEATVYGTSGVLDVVVDYEGTAGGYRLNGAAVDGAGENYYDTHRSIVADFAAAVRGGRAPTVTGVEALADLRVVIAALESLRRGGSPVEVEPR